MSTSEQSLLQALIELEQAAMPAGGAKLNLLPLFSRVDELTRQLPPDTDPALLHYLDRKSYGKARLWLEGRD